MTRFWTLGLLAPIACGLSAGCGASAVHEGTVVPVQGRVTNAGQPLTVKGQEIGLGFVEVKFCKYEGEGKRTAANDAFTTKTDASGSFKISGRFGHGIPPGKYRIAVRQWDPYPSNDVLAGKFDEEHSPFIRDITRRESLEIDLSKP